ncbi:MAG: replication-associated recombination protein A [Patescibacteria group bacterium]|nr:replication-associated recombination protein A [Patescibacteria group bacterium]
MTHSIKPKTRRQITVRPWADQLRPKEISDLIGQEELLNKDRFLAQAVELDNIPSMILWGPPGSGKTSLASVIAKATHKEFVNFSAATSGVGEVRKIISRAQELLKKNQATILFIDEIHRFNKKQQDILLPYVEKGTVTLIGATTENPSFEVNSALLSRTRVFVLKRLAPAAIRKILQNAVKQFKPGRKISRPLLNLIAYLSNGDARTAINTLELAIKSKKPINRDLIKEIFQKSHLFYDKNGEEHFNIISALHKSMRGGDADAALYWLARMLEGGEDPLYIARRLVRFASEDIGLANNSALMLAISTYQACHFLGLPECDVHLAHCAAYLAKSKKSVSAYKAMHQARQDAKKYGSLPVPLHIRNAPTRLMKDLKYGQGYKYSPRYNWKEKQRYFPEELKDKKYF